MTAREPALYEPDPAGEARRARLREIAREQVDYWRAHRVPIGSVAILNRRAGSWNEVERLAVRWLDRRVPR